MSHTVLVIAPHPDDESLGCGGTLLKHINNGDTVHWLIITSMSEAYGYTLPQVVKRNKEIEEVSTLFSMTSTTQLNFPPAGLDNIETSKLISEISSVIQKIKPNTVYLPFRYDVHSDHKVAFDAVISSTKSFRAPSIKQTLCYETLSETDFNLDPNNVGFRPNVWVDITKFMSQKVDILNVYESELSVFPFPRSIEAAEALAKIRGIQCNAKAAEAFMLLKEIR